MARSVTDSTKDELERKRRKAESYRKWYLANREKVLEKAKTYSAANRERKRRYNKSYRAANLERERERFKTYYEVNRDHHLERSKQYRKENLEKSRQGDRERYANNRDKKRSYARERMQRERKDKPAIYIARDREWRAQNPEKLLHQYARIRARKAGVAFSIKYSDVEIPTYCSVLNVKLEKVFGHNSPCSPTIDRIIPSAGYVVGNIAVISYRANSIKSDASSKEILQVARWLKQVEEKGLEGNVVPGPLDGLRITRGKHGGAWYKGLIVSAARARAPCTITKDDFVVPAHCPALGILLQRGTRSNAPSSPSLDRVVPSRGYVLGNVVIISQRANMIKQDATAAELFAVAHWLEREESRVAGLQLIRPPV